MKLCHRHGQARKRLVWNCSDLLFIITNFSSFYHHCHCRCHHCYYQFWWWQCCFHRHYYYYNTTACQTTGSSMVRHLPSAETHEGCSAWMLLPWWLSHIEKRIDNIFSHTSIDANPIIIIIEKRMDNTSFIIIPSIRMHNVFKPMKSQEKC